MCSAACTLICATQRACALVCAVQQRCSRTCPVLSSAFDLRCSTLIDPVLTLTCSAPCAIHQSARPSFCCPAKFLRVSTGAVCFRVSLGYRCHTSWPWNVFLQAPLDLHWSAGSMCWAQPKVCAPWFRPRGGRVRRWGILCSNHRDRIFLSLNRQLVRTHLLLIPMGGPHIQRQSGKEKRTYANITRYL